MVNDKKGMYCYRKLERGGEREKEEGAGLNPELVLELLKQPVGTCYVHVGGSG